MDVPDLYNFLAQKISKASNYGPEILAVNVETIIEYNQDRSDKQVE